MTLPWNRIGALSGIIFVVLLIVGGGLLLDSPESKDPDAVWLNYLNDDSNLVQNLIGAYILLVAAFAFVIFLVVLARNLRLASSGDDILPAIAFVGGVLFVASLLAAIAGLAAVPANIKFGDDAPIPSPDFAKNIQAVGFVALLIGGAFSAFVMIVATSVIILRTHLFAEWVAMLGFLAAILLIFAALFIPLIALPIWVLVVSGALARRPEITASP